MSISLCSLSSGSKGNCVYIGTDTTKLLVDCGVSADYVVGALAKIDVRAEQIDGILVTHRHSDHISGIPAFAKRFGTPIYVHHSEAACVTTRATKKLIVDFFGGDFFVGDITVSPFEVSHDVYCLGYSFYHRGNKVSVATDLGRLTPSVMSALSGSAVVMLESNHDEALLRGNVKYSEWLKRRISSSKGHLSNASCAEAVVSLAGSGTRQIVLAHLSEENNYPELAFSWVRSRLADAGVEEGKDVHVHTALQFEPSPVFSIDKEAI